MVKSPTDVIKSLLNKPQNFMLIMPRAFLACLEDGSPVLTKSSARFIFILQEKFLFICNCTERQHRFLVTPGTLSTPAYGQSSVFFCLRAREGGDLSLACFKVLTSKTRNDLAGSLEIDTLKGRRIEAIFNRFPCLTTPHECPKMSISTSTQSSRSD